MAAQRPGDVASQSNAAPITPTAMLGEERVLLLVPVLDGPPAAYKWVAWGIRLIFADGRPGPVLRLKPGAEAAIRRGIPASVVEVDERGAARATEVSDQGCFQPAGDGSGSEAQGFHGERQSPGAGRAERSVQTGRHRGVRT